MKYIATIAVISILFLQFFGAVPQSSVGGPMTLALVFLAAALAVGIHEAWTNKRSVLGWIVSVVTAVVGGVPGGRGRQHGDGIPASAPKSEWVSGSNTGSAALYRVRRHAAAYAPRLVERAELREPLAVNFLVDDGDSGSGFMMAAHGPPPLFRIGRFIPLADRDACGANREDQRSNVCFDVRSNHTTANRSQRLRWLGL